MEKWHEILKEGYREKSYHAVEESFGRNWETLIG